MIKKAWIEYHKKYKDDDYLIFPDDEELYSSVQPGLQAVMGNTLKSD